VIRAAWIMVAVIATATLAADWIAPHAPWQQFPDRAWAPPMRIHLRDASGWHAPFVYRQVLRDPITRAFDDDTTEQLPLRWFTEGRLVSVDDAHAPLLLLGADALGRDVWSRLLHGARLSLGVALAGAAAALWLGLWIGAAAGMWRGWPDVIISGVADLLIVLPSVYLVFLMRAAVPLTLDAPAVFGLLTLLFAVAGWPHVARGVRAVTMVEREKEYVEAARAAGAGRWRLLRHVMPASFGFLRAEAVLLVPAFLVAESTISYLGLGFLEPTPSWGSMLRDAASLSAMQRAPWLLTPALSLFVVVFLVQRLSRGPWRA
jgi:peptide/nickel transport system permease protein